MNIILNLSDQSHPKYTRISEVGMTLKALLQAYSEYEVEIAQTDDLEQKVRLRLEQEKTGEVFQKLMDTTGAAKEGWSK